MNVVRTSEKNWLERAIKFYAEKKAFKFIDDTGLNFSKEDLKSARSLLQASHSKGVPYKMILGALAGLGITGVGLLMIAAAVLDPEPTSKLGLLVSGGIVITAMGAWGTLKALGVSFSVSAKSPFGEFEIKPQ